ncbi:hypothetical protein ACKKBG_A33365 [Auxenochlorella protothecoides x Auxenochlorella symbiontica]
MVIKEYLAVKVAELRQAQDIVVRASQAGTFPDLKKVPESVLQTIQGTLLLLGLPVGIIYLSYRGLHYLVFATLQLPWVQALLNGIL